MRLPLASVLFALTLTAPVWVAGQAAQANGQDAAPVWVADQAAPADNLLAEAPRDQIREPRQTPGTEFLPNADIPPNTGFPPSAGLLPNSGFLPVELAYRLLPEVVDGRQLRLHWQIEPAHYLYKQHFAFRVEDAEGPIAARAQFPPGVERHDEYFGLSEVYYHSADISLGLARPAARATLTVTSQGCADAGLCYPPRHQAFAVDFTAGTVAPAEGSGPDGDIPPPLATGSPNPSPAPSTTPPLWWMLLLAFAGGALLNLMPCVFPVLSLKTLSLTGAGNHRLHGWAYAAGVVASFLLVALLLLALRQAGAAVGWGFHLQSPRFVAALAYLFFVMGLGLSGLVQIGAGLMGAGDRLANRGGYGGSFFTGTLATLVASPCTAPFMGTALGFAVTQTAPLALLVFAALGMGMAAPLLILSHSPGLRQRLPRPGAWMETFKQALALPLYATAVWLLWVAGRQVGVNAMAALLCGMLALAAGLWLWHRWGALAGAIALLAALAVIPSPVLERAEPPRAAGTASPMQQVARELERGRPLLVNVTADWCITCLTNERVALSNRAVQRALAERGVGYLEVDWTHYDPAVANFLARFGRNGVPLYLLYPGDGDGDGNAPIILPQILTPSIVLDALATLDAD